MSEVIAAEREVSIGRPVLTAAAIAEHPREAFATMCGLDGAFVLVDKPYAMTSFAVVNQVRRRITMYTGIKRVKVGHAGTLDPLASGLLIVATRRSTKAIESLSTMDKKYRVKLRFGISSPSHDLETEIQVTGDGSSIAEADVRNAIAILERSTQQIPPVFSAIKQQGKAVYHLARQGKVVTMTSRPVSYHDITMEQFSPPFATLSVHCGKGTYIRSMVRDLGEMLRVGATMIELERTAIGEYELSEAVSYRTLIDTFETVLKS